jgi:small conductance mechanosensitive channel
MIESIDISSITTEYVIPWGINVFFALAIFVIGRWVAKLIVKLLEKVLLRAKMDEILIKFVSSIVSSLLLLFIIIAALDQLGVNTTSLIALIGAAGLAVGLAMQNSLQNFAAGVMLIVFRPFTKGDFVEVGGVSGVVDAISILSTTMHTGDNRVVIVPNGSIYGSAITNYSARDTRRVDMVFGIGYNDDIKKAKEIMQDIVTNHELVLPEPEPLIAVSELADSSVNFNVRPWVKSSDYWAVRFDITEKIKLAFDENGISIPYPQMDVHMDKAE